MRILLRFARLAWRAGPVQCLAVLVGVLLSALAPLVAIGVVGALVAVVTSPTRSTSAATGTALWWALGACGLLLVQWTAGAARGGLAGALGERIDALLQRELMDTVMRPVGIGHLEDPRTLDLLSVGRDTFRASWGRPGRLASTVSALIAALLIIASATVEFVRLAPIAGIAVAAAGLWVAWEERVASRTEAAHHYGSAESARRLDYLYELGTSPAAAKEIRVFGLSGFLIGVFSKTWQSSMAAVIKPLPRRPTLASLTLGAAVLGSLAWIASRTADGHLSAGAATMAVQSLLLLLTGVQQTAWTGLQTELALATLRRFDEAASAVQQAGRPGTAPIAPQPGTGGPATGSRTPSVRSSISFEHVSFGYPGAERACLSELDLVIPAGRSLAIVGANGAGKSTLVKLLCRLYEPTSGRISVDGVDLAALDASTWWRELAAVFQDSTRFALPARVNVGFGRVADLEDQAGIVAAAAAAGIAGELEALESGWDSPLSAEFSGGADLSGGQWQKVALARALFAVRHGAQVLILDEPAAHLDARAEADLHERFLELTEGLTTVVISHRFSTVRRASSIVVLDEGRVVEQGTHDELIALGGRYAHMFAIQAARFTDRCAPHSDRESESGPVLDAERTVEA